MEKNDALDKAIDAMDKTTQLALEAAEMLHRQHRDDDDAPIEIDDAGWMHGDDVEIVETQRESSLKRGIDHVAGAAWHFTDTRSAGAVALARRIAKPGGPSRSCHVWLDAMSKIAQSVSFRRASWHAGSSTAKKFLRTGDYKRPYQLADRGGTINANDLIAGIEIENAGELRLIKSRDGKRQVFATWPYRWDYVPPGAKHPELPIVVPDGEVEDVAGKFWHRYTDGHVLAAERVARALVERYDIPRYMMEIGHQTIDPSRRTDPGPLWIGPGGHLEQILDRIYGPKG